MSSKLSFRGFYAPFHGHEPEHLQQITDSFRTQSRPIIYLAGDSSLDNKYWFEDAADAENGYEELVSPPKAKRDIAYWINKIAVERKSPYVCVNTAVEESTVGSRACMRLKSQDKVIRNNIQPNDLLIVSVGGNDIALAPNACTVLNMITLIKCMGKPAIDNSCAMALPCEECCCGCGFSCINACFGCPPQIGYFVHLFKTRIEAYIKNLTAVHRPKKILVCMIYYPDTTADGSWADATLAALGYDSTPEKLQLVIRRIFELATQQIKIPGSEVIAVPLFVALDGTRTTDYVQRVEPSGPGGEKMARLLFDALEEGGAADMAKAYREHIETLSAMDR